MKVFWSSRVVELDYNPSTLSFWVRHGEKVSLVQARRTDVIRVTVLQSREGGLAGWAP